MSVSVEVEQGLSSEGQSSVLDPVSKSSCESPCLQDVAGGQGDKNDDSEPGTPKFYPMAFTVDFGEGSKRFDNKRLEELAKKSQARHQRVQSMSASLTRPNPTPQKPPMSAKLPRKAQGYNSEGYFSSDQEDSGLSGSVKLKNSSLAPNLQRTSSQNQIANRHIKSPVNESCQLRKTSKSPIVDSIMSRSDNFVSRQGLILPLKGANSSYLRDVHRTPSYGNLSSRYQPKSVMSDIIDKSPEGVLLTDISSPELDILTPDNGLSTPEGISPVHRVRAMSETPDLFKKCTPKLETLYIDDDIDRESNSSTGTYTIEGDNYTEEQKTRMSIDRSIASNIYNESNTSSKGEKDPELIFDFQLKNPRVIPKDTNKSPIPISPSKVKEKNILEISCCYESPNENDLAAQTSKQIKSTRSYLEKIKNRVRNITEKTFAKSPPKQLNDGDFGCFTSVTTSGVLSTKTPPKTELPSRRRCSLSKSEIDRTDYVHRLSREASVPVSLPSNKPLQNAQFESTAIKNAHKILREEKESPDEVEKLSHMSLNRCKGDKTWIQEWADSVKKYNSNSLAATDSYVIDSDRPPLSPRHIPKPRSPHGITPSKIPSPVGTLLHRRTPDLIPTQDTEAYLLKTQNAITNLQAKLNSSRIHNIPSQLTSSLISDKSAASRLPVSQLSRSNSLNYRLRRKDASSDSSPLRSPGHYVITGSSKLPESTKILLNSASRSLDADKRRDLNMNSPNSDRDISNSSDDKTISNRPHYDVEAILSPHRKTHTRHKSFDGRPNCDYFTCDRSNANQAVCLKTVLKNNAMETKYTRIEPTRCLDTKKSHQRVFSEGNKQFRPVHPSNSIAFGMSIKRSSSFNTVNKNNNYVEPQRIISRRSSGQSEECRTDYLSDDSDNVSYDKCQEMRYKKVYKNRLGSPDLKSISTAPANSPSRRCPHTPEMHRKFGPGLVRNSVRVTNKERTVNTRMSEPPMSREERNKQTNHQSRKAAEPSRQSVFSRLTKSRSSTREIQPKTLEKGPKKPSQHRSSSALASKELEFNNWKKRSSYDPMKAAREGRKKQVAKRPDCKDDLSSPSHSSPVHRSQSFHTTNISELEILDYSSEDIDDDQLVSRLPMDPMLTSTQSCDVVFTRDYVAGFKVNQQPLKRHADNRRTFILDNDITPTKENIDFLTKYDDKRKTFILDSDTNSTTNGSSPVLVSSCAERASRASDTDDSEPNTHTHTHRHSGDYSMSSSTTSININKKQVQPRYMDISKYKSEKSPKNFLRRDPSKTYVGVLEKGVSKGSAQHYEMEQKKQELEKWKRRASYDPRKQAALGNKPVKTASSAVSRSASFHGGVIDNRTILYDGNSDNDF